MHKPDKPMKVQDFPFASEISPLFCEQLDTAHDIVKFNAGQVVTTQYDIGEYFYFLMDGAVSFSIKINDEHEELIVGTSQRVFTPVGWSGFRHPHRYATTVSCPENSTFIRWKHEDLKTLLFAHPSSGQAFLKFIVFESQLMLQETRGILTHFAQESSKSFLDLHLFSEISKSPVQNSVDILKRSPFFEIYSEEALHDFAAIGESKTYARGEKIFKQYESADYFDVLIEGKVALIYSLDDKSNKLDKRVIQNEGYIVGSGCFTKDKLNHVSCVALANSTILRINYQKLTAYLEKNVEIGIPFYLRLLWFISHRLSSARAKLITIKYDGEILAVKNLIEQNCTQLSVVSELHKVPHLLAHTFTLNEGIKKLHDVKNTGSTLERNIANASLEILTAVLKEHEFYHDLSHLYHEVVNAPTSLSHFEVRTLCSQRFIDAFEKTNYILKGEENLPNEPSIFIYNHLMNHVFNTLPNNFQLTLDSHFISSVILYKKYKNPGIRVVRVPKGEEYGHQYYYERLGHIPVYTKDSKELVETEEEKKQRRAQFYQTASEYLENGTSIMLAPEGQSLATNASPAEFKPGAFRLPTFMKTEPHIVPIAMANFDKRLNHSKFCAVIKKPFKISDKVENPNNMQEMTAFLKEYQKEFRTYVEEAIDLSKSSNWISLVEEV